MSDDQLEENLEIDAEPGEPPQYGIGPFSIREVAIAAVWLVAFVVSFFPVYPGPFPSVWATGIEWVRTIGVPTAAVFLLGLRRLSPTGIRRVGSLGIDQFASVAFSVAALVWGTEAWAATVSAAQLVGSPVFFSWVTWVELVLMLLGVVLTVFAPLIPPFAEDFRGRREVPAHRNARPLRPISPRPVRVVEATVVAPIAESGILAAEHADTPEDAWAPAQAEDTYEAHAVVDAAPASHQAFWALVPEVRDVVDESGVPLFRIGPAAWALVLEDRGEVYVVRDEDGRIGFLHDVSGVTRG